MRTLQMLIGLVVILMSTSCLATQEQLNLVHSRAIAAEAAAMEANENSKKSKAAAESAAADATENARIASEVEGRVDKGEAERNQLREQQDADRLATATELGKVHKRVDQNEARDRQHLKRTEATEKAATQLLAQNKSLTDLVKRERARNDKQDSRLGSHGERLTRGEERLGRGEQRVGMLELRVNEAEDLLKILEGDLSNARKAIRENDRAAKLSALRLLRDSTATLEVQETQMEGWRRLYQAQAAGAPNDAARKAYSEKVQQVEASLSRLKTTATATAATLKVLEKQLGLAKKQPPRKK